LKDPVEGSGSADVGNPEARLVVVRHAGYYVVALIW
jgi:hypothetical protein